MGLAQFIDSKIADYDNLLLKEVTFGGSQQIKVFGETFLHVIVSVDNSEATDEMDQIRDLFSNPEILKDYNL